MKRLRHPIRAIEEPFGKAGLMVAVIALVLALTGAAFAAGGLNGKQKKEVKKIAKTEAQKFANSNPGSEGKQGPAGKDGTNGTNGSNGTDGKSVVVGTANPEPAHCEAGGATVEVEGNAASRKYVCNGKAGEPGAIHPGEALPSGATETGVWSVTSTAGNAAAVLAPLSFPIPLELSLNESHVVFLNGSEGETPECPGTASSPEAEPGYLCVYTQFTNLSPGAFGAVIHPPAEEGSVVPNLGGAGLPGAVIAFEPVEEEGEFPFELGLGTWAVTAP